MKSRHKGLYTRGYLPHLDIPRSLQFITMRLHDSIPQSVLAQYQQLPKRDKLVAYEKFLDSGCGACNLIRDDIAQIIQESLLFLHKKSLFLHAWVIMPNHIHLLLEIFEDYSLPNEMRRFKSFTALSSNKKLRTKGQFWMKDYFDRSIRNEEHLRKVIQYIEYNPVKAGLCIDVSAWKFSSAYKKQ